MCDILIAYKVKPLQTVGKMSKFSIYDIAWCPVTFLKCLTDKIVCHAMSLHIVSGAPFWSDEQIISECSILNWHSPHNIKVATVTTTPIGCMMSRDSWQTALARYLFSLYFFFETLQKRNSCPKLHFLMIFINSVVNFMNMLTNMCFIVIPIWT